MQLLRHPHRQVRPKLLRLREPHRDRPRLQRPGHGGRGRRHRGVTRQRRRGEVELPHQLLNRRLRRRRGHRRPRRRRRPSSPLLLLPRHLSNPPNPHEATRSTRRPFSLPPSLPATPIETPLHPTPTPTPTPNSPQPPRRAARSRPPSPDRGQGVPARPGLARLDSPRAPHARVFAAEG